MEWKSRKVAEKSNLSMTTLHFNYLYTYNRGEAKANQTSRGKSFCDCSWGPKAVFQKKHFVLGIALF